MSIQETRPLTRILSNVGDLYHRHMIGEISLITYLHLLGDDTCATPRCPYPATHLVQARRYCDVCAMQARRALSDADGLPFDDTHRRD